MGKHAQRTHQSTGRPTPTAWCKTAIISLIASLLPLLFYLIVQLAASSHRFFATALIVALPLCALVGLTTGVIAIVVTRHRQLRGRVLGIIGAVLSLVWLCLSVYVYYIIFAILPLG